MLQVKSIENWRFLTGTRSVCSKISGISGRPQSSVLPVRKLDELTFYEV